MPLIDDKASEESEEDASLADNVSGQGSSKSDSDCSSDGDIAMLISSRASGSKQRSNKPGTAHATKKDPASFHHNIHGLPESDVLQASKGEYTNRVDALMAASFDVITFSLCQSKHMMPKSDIRWASFLRKGDNMAQLQLRFKFNDTVPKRWMATKTIGKLVNHMSE